jgi:hypothetical protein
MYQCMQVAFWHGIQTLLVVGLDHDYFEYKTMPKHFDDRYVQKPEEHPQVANRMANPKYGEQHKLLTDNAYRLARKVFEHDGRRIINLTPDSKCEIFERGDVDDWILGDDERSSSVGSAS